MNCLNHKKILCFSSTSPYSSQVSQFLQWERLKLYAPICAFNYGSRFIPRQYTWDMYDTGVLNLEV